MIRQPKTKDLLTQHNPNPFPQEPETVPRKAKHSGKDKQVPMSPLRARQAWLL